MSPSETPDRPPRRRSLPLTVVLWVVQILLAAFFLFQGATKLLGSPSAVRLFEDIGLGQWLRYVTGVCEVAGAVGLLIAPLSGLAALGLLGVMIGATAGNLLTPGYASFAIQTVALGVVFALLAWARWPETRSLPERLRKSGKPRSGT
ncbi:DoxX family protein [Streptomonospora litoralis]|uniref:DoxX n=1 Tax=Streptomonospora litoralis TaxID=2498135 RepID=A0A4P6Q6S4_9ACTN|nr:DoxX family protein [Streptomonospora litoralis]QBI56478.1 DoxX [Streptomonospora litoralis]